MGRPTDGRLADGAGQRPIRDGGDPGWRLTPDEIAAVATKLGVRYVPPESAD